MGSAASANVAVPDEYHSLPDEAKLMFEKEYADLVSQGKSESEAMTLVRASGFARHETAKLLEMADQDDDGVLTVDEIKQAQMQKGLSEAEATRAASDVLNEVDTDGDGIATVDELVQAGTQKWLDIFNEKLVKEFFGGFETLKAGFATADVNGGGTLSYSEFGTLMRETGGIQITDAQIATAFQQVDTNSDGLVNWIEFVRCLAEDADPAHIADEAAPDRAAKADSPSGIASLVRARISRRYRDLKSAFLALDPDRSGYIDTKEVQELLKSRWCTTFSDQDVNIFVASYQHNSDGGFSYVEFCKMVDGQQPFKGMC